MHPLLPAVAPEAPMLVLLLALAAPARAEDAPRPRPRDTEIGWARPTGVGIALGQPTGVTAKRYLDRRARHAVDGTLAVHSLAWGFGGLYAHGGWSFHPSRLHADALVEVPWRLGAGIFVGTTSGLDTSDPPGWGYPYPRPNTGFAGIRGVVGVDVDLIDAPVQIFVELAPSLTLAPELWASLGGTLGGRYYF